MYYSVCFFFFKFIARDFGPTSSLEDEATETNPLPIYIYISLYSNTEIDKTSRCVVLSYPYATQRENLRFNHQRGFNRFFIVEWRLDCWQGQPPEPCRYRAKIRRRWQNFRIYLLYIYVHVYCTRRYIHIQYTCKLKLSLSLSLSLIVQFLVHPRPIPGIANRRLSLFDKQLVKGAARAL